VCPLSLFLNFARSRIDESRGCAQRRKNEEEDDVNEIRLYLELRTLVMRLLSSSSIFVLLISSEIAFFGCGTAATPFFAGIRALFSAFEPNGREFCVLRRISVDFDFEGFFVVAFESR